MFDLNECYADLSVRNELTTELLCSIAQEYEEMMTSPGNQASKNNPNHSTNLINTKIMSKRNSKEAKAERRQKYLAKQDRFSNPVAKPEQDYIHHYGFVPNDPFFENAAVAINQPDAKAAFPHKATTD